MSEVSAISVDSALLCFVSFIFGGLGTSAYLFGRAHKADTGCWAFLW